LSSSDTLKNCLHQIRSKIVFIRYAQNGKIGKSKYLNICWVFRSMKAPKWPKQDMMI